MTTNETVGLKEAEKLLFKSLNEEKTTGQMLTEVAIKVVSREAAVEQA